MQRTRRRSHLVAACALAIAMVATLARAQSAPAWVGVDATPSADRLGSPEDRYAMAGGCYAIRPLHDSGYVTRVGSGFAATAETLSAAEPFHFQATDLGQYLLFSSSKTFLAAGEGLAAQAAYAATRSLPGQIAGGLVLEKTDEAADTIARSPANTATGRGGAVVAATFPSELADWVIAPEGDGFSLVLPSTNQRLTESVDHALLLRPATANDKVFEFELTDGCAAYPEVEVNVTGPVTGGVNAYQETRGYLEAHLHMMAFEFIGGRTRCGRPWHRYGAAYALVDCPDHQPGGQGSALEYVLSGGDPVNGHDTSGWPTFKGWPKPGSLTHEQVYYKWLERAWRGGLRMFVNLLVDNRQLCQVYPFKRNSCNEMEGVRLQAQRIHELERYIDAQSGGPGEGWFRIVLDPFQARRVMNEGKLAVVLGIEVSVPLDCGLTVEVPMCDLSQIDQRLNEVYALDVRQMELVNKFDNALSGVTGDDGATGVVTNTGNKGETGRFLQMETCHADDGDAHDKQQMNFTDDAPMPDEFTDRDSLVGGILQLFGPTGVAPVYPEGPHCNVRALSDLGRSMILGLVRRGMIFDPDHMSARARTQALDLIESAGYSGVVSSHGWSDDTIYPRVIKAGGVVAPHAGSSSSFVGKWRKHKAWADPRFPYGIGIGSDMNGFSTQGSGRGAGAANPVTYPFAGFGGATVDKQVSGTRTPYDVNVDGAAHYGLYPDWIEDVRHLLGTDAAAFTADIERGPEAYLQMWERAIGIGGDACRTDIADLTDARIDGLTVGMTTRAVLEAVGQPSSRLGNAFTYCMTGGRTATATFSPTGTLLEVAR